MNNTENFVWSLTILISCFIGTTICGIAAVIYKFFFA